MCVSGILGKAVMFHNGGLPAKVTKKWVLTTDGTDLMSIRPKPAKNVDADHTSEKINWISCTVTNGKDWN